MFDGLGKAQSATTIIFMWWKGLFLTANYIVGEFPTTISGKYIKKDRQEQAQNKKEEKKTLKEDRK
jgi:hypothetical protein